MIEQHPASPEHIEQAARLLAQGGLVAFPTETVYGLGANATSSAAVAGIFHAKRRPSYHPLIVHVLGREQAEAFAASVPACAQRLMASHWPGPLTLILPRKAGVAASSAGHQNSIGLRCPSHPVAVALLKAALAHGVQGISAPSANPFGRLSPTTAQHVADGFASSGTHMLVLDGGPCEVGIESTIVDCTRGAPVLLRPGMLSLETLSASAGEPVLKPEQASQAAPRSSGSLEQHYAPRATLRLMSPQQIQTALDLLGPDAKHLAIYARSPIRSTSSLVTQRRMPHDAAATAQQLFAVLHGFDQAGVKLIWVEQPPADTDWDGVRDRLTRAAA
jgi:L-threonylcarbamoyladenylate synthase